MWKTVPQGTCFPASTEAWISLVETLSILTKELDACISQAAPVNINGTNKMGVCVCVCVMYVIYSQKVDQSLLNVTNMFQIHILHRHTHTHIWELETQESQRYNSVRQSKSGGRRTGGIWREVVVMV